MKNIKIFACQTAEPFTQEICDVLGLPMGKKESFKFKNDNNFVKLSESVRDQDVFVVQTTLPPVNERIMELLITLDALKRASAKSITVVLPYFIYARSDKKDQPRIPITAKLFASLLETAGATRVLTCDLHAASIQGFFNINCDHLTARYLLTDYFKNKNINDLVVVATDAGSSKKAYKYAKSLDAKIALIDKRREGNDDRAIATHVIGDVKGKTAIIFDDEVDTAGSIIETVNTLNEHGVKEIYAGCTHPVLSGPAIERIKNSNIKEFVVTNTIPLLPEKQIPNITVLSMASLFAEAIKRINEGQPLGELFDY